MRTISILILINLVFLKIAFAQKKVWNDDKEPILKADTSQVSIDGKDYQKYVTVTYSEIKKEKLKQDYVKLKTEVRYLLEQKDELNDRIGKLRNEMQSLKSLYQANAKKKKWEEDDLDEPDPVPAETLRREKLLQDFMQNPRNKKQ